MQPRALLEGLAMPESPRWHDGRLWFSNWGAGQIVAVDLDGNSEVVPPVTQAMWVAPRPGRRDHTGST